MTQKECKCDICERNIPGGNLSRHRKRKHDAASSLQPQPLPVERSETVRDVLLACGFDARHLGSWDMKELDRLPNFRHYKPTPRRHHTEWKVVTYDQFSTLPSLEDILVDVASRSREGRLYKRTEFWQGSKQIEFTPREWSVWIKQILKSEQVETRALNMPMDFVCPEVTRTYHRFAADAMSKNLPDLATHGFRQNRAEANVTPRGTKTEVHHDSEHHISIAVGMKTRERGPLKLWLLWPSTELRHLASCYADTNAALARMDHGSFLVQMPGEAVIVPPNSPHAVFALESCYLYGQTFSVEDWAYEPSSVLVNVRIGDSADEACRARITQLSLGLSGSAKLRQACVDQFIETWALEAAVYRERRGFFEQLVALWTVDTNGHGLCAWCTIAGESRHPGLDGREHMRAHLESRGVSMRTTTTSIS